MVTGEGFVMGMAEKFLGKEGLGRLGLGVGLEITLIFIFL